MPGVRRHDAEVVEGALPPAEEGVALAVALELALRVPEDGHPRAELVDLHGVVDDELGGDLRVDGGRVAAERDHRLAHRGEVDDRGDAREVLEEDARWAGRRSPGRLGVRVPAGDSPHLVGAAVAQGLGAEDVLQQDAERVRKPGDVGLARQSVEPRDRMRPPAGVELTQSVRRCPPSSSILGAASRRPWLVDRARLGPSTMVSRWPSRRSRRVPVAPEVGKRGDCLLTRNRVIAVVAVAGAIAVALVVASLLSARGGDGGGGGEVTGAADVEAMLQGIPQDGTVLGKPMRR